MRAALCLAVLLVISAAFAGPVSSSAVTGGSPRTLKARDALAKHETIARKLRVDYYTKLAEADSQLVHDLDIALHLAASNADGQEIDRINAARTKAQEALKRDTQESRGFIAFNIQADAGWQDTIELHRGDLVVVQASGSWTPNVHDPKSSCGPDGLGGAPPRVGALIGNLKGQKDDAAVQIGSGRQFVSPIDGMFELGMRGHAPIGSGLNDGALEVLIRVTPSGQ